MYVYGNVVPKPEQEPERRQVRRPKKKVSRQVQRNRKKALRMSPGYVVFLSAAAILALIICVNYVKLQSRMTGYSKNISALQGQLANMKEENNTKYNAIMDSVNLEEIRERAQESLGMVYATSEQRGRRGPQRRRRRSQILKIASRDDLDFLGRRLLTP